MNTRLPARLASPHRTKNSLVDRVETAAKVPKEAVPVFKSQEADAPATVAEVQKEVSSATTKVRICTRACVHVLHTVHGNMGYIGR